LAAGVSAVLGALALLVYSFALDVLWLFRHRHTPSRLNDDSTKPIP
jgi:hypothetical protein